MSLLSIASFFLHSTWLHSCLVSSLLAYVITHSLPPSCTWDTAAPVPVSLVLLSIMKSLDQLGRARIGVNVDLFFNVLKAAVLSLVVHLK